MLYLDVPFSEKEEVKALGAKWDSSKLRWYVPATVSPKPFRSWWPRDAKVNTFVSDLEWSVGFRNRVLIPSFYQARAFNNRFVVADKGAYADHIQRRDAVDTFLNSDDRTMIAIEEKIVRKPRRERPFSKFFIEVESCTLPGKESEGWIKYGRADKLLYAFEVNDTEADCYYMNFDALQVWFLRELERKSDRWRASTLMETMNQSRGFLVPIRDVVAEVPGVERFRCVADGGFFQLDPT